MSKGRGWKRLREPRVIDDRPVTVTIGVLEGHRKHVRLLRNRIAHLRAEVDRQAEAARKWKQKADRHAATLWQIRCDLNAGEIK